MSEKDLDNVIRVLRVAKEHLNLAEIYSDSYLHDHNAVSRIHNVTLALSDVTDYFDVDYKQSHYKKKSRRYFYGSV